MKESDVILTAMPQADGNVKHRPAVILRDMPPFGDMLVCGVSTQLHQYVRGFDEIITPEDTDFASKGTGIGERQGGYRVVPGGSG